MRMILRSALLAVLLIAAPALPLGAAQAAPAAAEAGAAAQMAPAAFWAVAGTSATPSPGDTASTGPANPGTGESTQNESTRVNFAPWVIGGIALVTLIVVLIWRRRRNSTIV